MASANGFPWIPLIAIRVPMPAGKLMNLLVSYK
jgi:hypothetical protein